MITVTTPPAQLAISLDTVKAHLLLLETDLDVLLQNLYIPAATREVEAQIRRALITQTVEQTFDCFPSEGYFLLERCPLVSFTKLEYFDRDETWQELDSDDYQIMTGTLPPIVRIKDTKRWPVDAHRTARGGVKATYVVGYGATHTSVPVAIQQAISMMVGDMVVHREDTMALTGLKTANPGWHSKVLLDPYRVNYFEHASQSRI